MSREREKESGPMLRICVVGLALAILGASAAYLYVGSLREVGMIMLGKVGRGYEYAIPESPLR